MKKTLFFLWLAAMVVLHQDFWLWKDKTLVFGFMPIGLAYHAGYSILAAISMAVLVTFAWPKELDQPHTNDRGDRT